MLNFERHAEFLKLTGEWRAMSLANCLSGKSKNVYDLLDLEQAKDFECIKLALLSAFQIDSDSCKTKFENAKLLPMETMSQFLVRLNGLWKKWEDMA